MKLTTQLGIDHYLGGPISWLLNILAQIVALFWQRNHSLNSPPQTILFLKFMGLGSIARSACLLQAAREKYPAAKIYFVTFPRCASLPPLYPQVDQTRVIRDNNIFVLAIDIICFLLWSWKTSIDLVIDLEVHSKFSSILSTLTLAQDRAGFATVTSRFRRGLYTHLVFWNPIHHVDTAYEQLGKALGFPARRQIVAPKISQDASTELNLCLEKLGVPQNTIFLGINPHTSELRLERRWPVKHFANLASALSGQPGLTIFLLGSAAERAHNEALLSQIIGPKQTIFNMAGLLSFEAYLCLLSKLKLLLTNDSAPLHLAEALSVRTISLWGPTAPNHLAPQSEGHLTIYKPIYCSPCTHTTDIPPCGGDNQCLKQITWQEVTNTISKQLALPLIVDAGVLRDSHHTTNSYPVHGYWEKASVPRACRNEPCPVCGHGANMYSSNMLRSVARAGLVASCQSCGTWYRAPRPNIEVLAQIYQKDYYNSWNLQGAPSAARLSKRASFAPLLDMAQAKLKGDNISLLDVGAATGILMELAKERGWISHGIEFNPYSAQLLRDSFGADKIYEGELLHCPFPKRSFQIIMLCDVLEHVLDIRGTLAAARELLAPGGIIFITTPRIDTFSRKLMGRNWLHFKEEHIQYFSASSLRTLLSDLKFLDVEIQTHSKYLTLDYLYAQLTTYKHFLLTPLLCTIHGIAPRFIRQYAAPYACGEMLAIARTDLEPLTKL